MTPTDARFVKVDLPGLACGVAEYDEGPTGCTVLLLDRASPVTIDVRGGMPGVHNPTATKVEAVCIAGGSILGLSACTGVADALYADRGGDPRLLPLVTGGVIYDFAPPGRSGVHPDAALGAAALRAAAPGRIPVGRVGAGRSATCGKMGRPGWAEAGGQGAATGTADGARVVVITVVNALGVVVDRGGQVVRGNRDPETGVRSHISPEDMAHGHQRQAQHVARSTPTSTATTQTVVVTDAALRRSDLTQLARQVHASMARAIHPFHCTGDGDTLFMLATGTADGSVVTTALGACASEVAWNAVLEAVRD